MPGHVDGVQVAGQPRRIAAWCDSRRPSSAQAATRSIATAARRENRQIDHCTFPRGRDAIMLSAHSTAVIAAMRRLSDAAHSQNDSVAAHRGAQTPGSVPAPRHSRCWANSSPPCRTSTCSPEMAATISSICAALLQLNVKRKCVSVEDGSLQQHQRRYAQPGPAQCSGSGAQCAAPPTLAWAATPRHSGPAG